MRKKTKKILIYLFAFFVSVSAFAVGYTYYTVIRETSERIEIGAIDRIIASESPVYYDDGISPIGVFFERTHRKYIPYGEMPKDFINALVATEDKNFFEHNGFDLKAIIRATLANLKAGRIVQGGSTITQQTAKNIFRREKRTYWAKLKELMQSILLEKKYSKEQILEMYCNQFFVTGYGKGLGIAAQYFFDKDPKDLDLVESAFIAGAMKAPNRYNPFIKISEDAKREARLLAKLRKDYVLSNMLKMNFITEDQYLCAKEKEVPFKEGRITYGLNVILDYVRKQLESDFFQKILSDQGIDNFATSGISIHTSINKNIQEKSLQALRNHLPLLDVMLNGYKLYDIAAKPEGLLKEDLITPKGTLPFLAKITRIERKKSGPKIYVSWKDENGIIDSSGLLPICRAWKKWKSGAKNPFEQKDLYDFLKNLRTNDLITIRKVISGKEEDNGTKLVLSQVPQLEGGILVLKKGMIKCMVGGFFNRFFNRAVDAKRQLGSIFKPIVYTAALQLKWNILDPLPNRRQLYRFENVFYMPRPDHTPHSEMVSLAWAGVKSENLATVNLLYHLTDKLNKNEFKQLTSLLDLYKKGDESYTEYKRRIRDLRGVVVNRESLMEAAFEKSKQEMESDIIFMGDTRLLENFQSLYYRVERQPVNTEDLIGRNIEDYSFQKLRELNNRMKRRFDYIIRIGSEARNGLSIEFKEKFREYSRYFYRKNTGDDESGLIYLENNTGNPLQNDSLLPLTVEWMADRIESIKSEGILINGIIPSGILDVFQTNLEENYRRLSALKSYDFDVLYRIRDFRTLVNISYVVYLAKKMGISTPLEKVLSFPLGPNSISILEAAEVYQTIMTGKVFEPSRPESQENAPIIQSIADRNGEIIWQNLNEPERILSERVSGQVSEVLRMVMKTGTGRSARDAVKVFGIKIPIFGKTGTANRFMNSSFVGFIPGVNREKEKLDLEEGYVIASYVGYDDNRPMKSNHMVIYGSSGALPLWVDSANAIVSTDEYLMNLQLADLAFEPLERTIVPWNENSVPVSVSPVSGLPEDYGSIPEKSSSPIVYSDPTGLRRNKTSEKHFEPLKGVNE